MSFAKVSCVMKLTWTAAVSLVHFAVPWNAVLPMSSGPTITTSSVPELTVLQMMKMHAANLGRPVTRLSVAPDHASRILLKSCAWVPLAKWSAFLQVTAKELMLADAAEQIVQSWDLALEFTWDCWWMSRWRMHSARDRPAQVMMNTVAARRRQHVIC
jgi:hypothetical protein